jgi:hypothetical protein
MYALDFDWQYASAVTRQSENGCGKLWNFWRTVEIVFSSFLLVLSFYMLMHTVKYNYSVFLFLIPFPLSVCALVHACVMSE